VVISSENQEEDIEKAKKLGIPIVSEDYLNESIHEGILLDPKNFPIG
jgi:hypothetical protein